MNITNNFTLEELTYSATAKALNIPNTPNDEQTQNIVMLAYKVLQPIRDEYGKPIIVSSGFRSLALNTKIKGARNSQHLYGEAADIHTVTNAKKDNRELFDVIKKMVLDGKIQVGQLIDEYNCQWVHVSLPTAKHKNEIFSVK